MTAVCYVVVDRRVVDVPQGLRPGHCFKLFQNKAFLSVLRSKFLLKNAYLNDCVQCVLMRPQNLHPGLYVV